MERDEHLHCVHCLDHEKRLSAIETAVALLRWAVPVLVTGTGVIVVLAR